MEPTFETRLEQRIDMAAQYWEITVSQDGKASRETADTIDGIPMAAIIAYLKFFQNTPCNIKSP